MHLSSFIHRKNTPLLLLWSLIISFCIYFSVVAFARHDNFHSRRLDLGNMEQTVWNVVHGNGFTLSDPMGTENISRLAVHADYLLVLMAPFYMIWQDPKMLILVQTIVMCLGALPVFWIAVDRLRSRTLALLFATAYLLYPPLQRMMLHDFHAVALSMTFLLFAYWYMYTKRYGLFLLFAILAGLGKETVWIPVALMGVYIWFVQKKKMIGIPVALAGAGTFYYLFWHAIPGVTPDSKHFALQYLSEFGDNQSNIVLNIMARPLAVLVDLLKPDRLHYYYQLLFPVGFLPVFSPFYLVYGAHSIVINALSTNSLMRQIDYQYTADIIPFLFVSAIEGYKNAAVFVSRWAGKRKKSMTHVVPVVLVSFVLAASYMWGELPLTRQDRFFYFLWPLPEKEIMKSVEDRIPSEYTVSVTNNIGAHFAKRERLYNFPVNALSADYAVALLGDQYAWPSGVAQREAVDALLNSPEHTLIARAGGFYAFERICP